MDETPALLTGDQRWKPAGKQTDNLPGAQLHTAEAENKLALHSMRITQAGVVGKWSGKARP